MPLNGISLGRYRLLQLIGSGNMGEVYLAEDAQLSRRVAIKVTRAEASSYPDLNAVKEATRLFMREAKTIAQLDHPYILPLFDFGEERVNGATLTYIVMPLRDEGSLTTWLQQRGTSALLSPQDVLHFIRQAADALQYAHNRQIVHQDVKPANFLIRRSSSAGLPDLQLADFGIARLALATATSSQTIRGTPAYMAPEQWSGQPVPASDQYALAIMTYELLTGRLPFQGSMERMMYQHMSLQPTPPSQLNAKLSGDSDFVLLRAMAKKPEERFASVSAFANALEQALLRTTGTIKATPQVTATVMAVPAEPATLRPQSVRLTPIPEVAEARISLTISSTEALTGTNRSLNFPDGRQATIALPAGTYNGQVFRLEGLGGGSYADGRTTDAAILTVLVVPAAPLVLQASAGNLASPMAATGPGPLSFPPPVPPAPTRSGFPKIVTALLVILILLVVAGGGGLWYLYQTRVPGSPTKSVPTSAPTVNITATAQTIASQNPYTHSGTLVLDDPLADNSKGVGWQTGINGNKATCEFRDGAYHATQPLSGFFHSCTAFGTNYTNVAFEVQMRMISGDFAGIIFCKAADNNYYLFRIRTDGAYQLYLVSNSTLDNAPVLASGQTNIDLSQINTIAVVVDHGSIKLYVNGQLLTSAIDNTYTHGAIGVFAWNDHNSADTAFSNARVWML